MQALSLTGVVDGVSGRASRATRRRRGTPERRQDGAVSFSLDRRYLDPRPPAPEGKNGEHFQPTPPPTSFHP